MNMKFIPAFLLLLVLTANAYGQAAKQLLSVPTIADLEMRIPQAGEVVEVRNGSASNLWAAPRTFVYRTNTETADRVYVVTNRVAGTRYVATDRDNKVCDLSLWATGDGSTDDTAGITAAALHLQQIGGGTLYGLGTFKVSTTGVVASFTNLPFLKIDVRGSFVTADLGDSTFTSVILTNLGSTATATWSSPHGLSAGRVFVIKNATDEAFDGVWTVASSNSPTVLTFALTSYNVPSGPATAIASVSDIGRALFRFDNCTNVDVGTLVFRGVEHPRNIQYRHGYRVLEVRKGSRQIRGNLIVSGASYGWYTGEYSIQSLGGCSEFNVSVSARSVGYPVGCYGSGWDSIFNIICENVHRGGYFGGVKRSTASIWVKNFDVAGAIINHQPDGADQFGCEDLTLRVYDTGTTEPIDLLSVGGTRYLATISGYAATNEVRHRNLDVRVYGKNMIQTSGLLVQTVNSNHWIDGLKFGGVLDQSGIAFTNARTPLFIYATTPDDEAGQFRDVVLRDWKFIAPADADGSLSAWVVLAHAKNDVVFDGYESSGIETTVGLPAGIHAVTSPRFPDWDHASFESAQVQRVRGGVKLSAAKTIVPMSGSLGTNDFTLQWVGEVPSGNAGLFAITTGSAATAGSFGASITNGDLIVRAYGATASDWSGVTATNWANGIRGKVASLGVVKTFRGLELFTDGHTTAGISTTSGTPPSWTGVLSGTNAYVGIDDAASEYLGTVYRFAVWNYDRADQFPALAVRWDAGMGSSGSSGETVGALVSNGGFETLGIGGADVFDSWTESVSGGSTISVSTNAVQGTNSLAMTVDGSASFAGITSSATMVDGAAYEITFWARIPGGSSGQIALVGAAGGDYPISISGAWTRYSRILLWNSATFSIKRWSLTGQIAELDAITIRRVGTLCDFDWTTSPADQVTGSYSSPLGGAATRVNARGFGVSQDRGDNSASLEVGQDAPVQVWESAITGPRTVTLQTNHARRGDVFRIIRKDAGSGTLAINTSPSVTLMPNKWVDVVFEGTAWAVSGYGSITSGSESTVLNFSDLPALEANTGEIVFVKAGSEVRKFYGTNALPASGTNRANASASSNPAKWWVAEDINVRPQKAVWWGMVGDGTTDNSAAFADLLAFSRDIQISRGRYAFASPVAITNAESISITSPDGSYQGGYHSTNLVTECEFVYTGPATNIFFDFEPTPPGTLRYGNRVENITFNANGLADTSVRIGHMGRARFVGCRFLGGTGVNWLVNASQFCTFIDCSTSINDETPTPTVRATYGMSLTNFSPANVFIDCQWENSSGTAVLLAGNAKNNSFVGGAIEANDGDGLVLESGATGNTFSGTWFEANGGTNSLWVKSGAIQNTFSGLRMYEDAGAVRVSGSYNSFRNFGASTIWIEPAGTRNKWENMLWVTNLVDQTAGGQLFMDMINAPATVRSNTWSSPIVQYGEPFKLWNGTNVHERASLQFGGVFFGDGSNPPDAGWSRLSASSLATSNTVVFLTQGVNDTLISAYAPGDAQPRVRLSVGQSLAFGAGGSDAPDVILRRLSSGNFVADDTAVLALRTNVNALGFGAGMTNDTATRIAMTAGGRLLFGDGASAQTASISFDSAGTIRVTTNLVVDGGITLGGVTRLSWPTGGTNASTVFFDGTAVDSPNILSGPEILLTIAGVTNITLTIKTNSIGTNQFNNTTYAAVFSGAIAESRVDAAIARLLSPAFTGSPTAPTAADGVSNTVLATTAWVLRNAGTGGGGSGNANTNASQAWAAGYTNTANGRWVFNGDVLAGSTNLVQKLGNIELALTGYQPLDTDLTALALLNGAGLTNLSASTAFSSGTVPIARLATGTPDGTKFVRDDGVLAVPAGGGGGGDAYLANDQTFTGINTFHGATIVSNMTVLGTLGVDIIEADSLVLGSPIGITALASNAAAARALLGVTYDVDVQSFSAHLHRIATNSWAANDLMLFNGSAFEALATTAAGRALLTAANAAAQRSSLDVGQLDTSAYGSGWDGVVDKTPTLNAVYDKINSLPGGSNSVVSVTAPLSLVDGVLSIDTSGLGGGGGGWTYLLTNGPGAWQGRDSSTNWTILSATISSNSVPSATGRFVEGGWSLMVSNNSGSTATLYHDVAVNGTQVFRDSYSLSSGAGVAQRAMAAQFWLIRESSTTAALVQMGQNANSSSTPAGQGDFGSTLNAATIVVTNIAVSWSSNVSLSFAISCDTSTSTNAALGLRTVNSWIRTDATSSSGSGDVVGPASATDGHLVLFDGSTGKVIKDGTLTESTIATDAEVSAAIAALSSTYQPLDADLTDLADGTLTGSKVGTGISGDNVTTGTVAEARIDTAIARLDSPGITGTPTVNGTNLMEAIASAGGGMPMLSDTSWTAKGQLVQGNGTSSATILAPGNIGDMLRYNGTNLVWVDDRTYWEISYEGGASTLHPDFLGFSGNGGSSPSAAYPGEAGHPGVIGGSTGSTTTNGYTGWATRNSAIIGGYGAHGASGWMKTPGVLPSSEPSLTLVGLHDQNSATAVVDGPGFFRLSTLGDFFQFVSRNNSSETTNPVVTSVTANTWYHWRVSVAHGGSNSVGWINGVAVGTNTSNIPTGSSRAYGVGLFMADDGGVTNNNQTLYIDSVRAGGFR